jgi:transposase
MAQHGSRNTDLLWIFTEVGYKLDTHIIVTYFAASRILRYMGNPAGAKRNFDALEMRRMQAAELLKQGIHEAEVARLVGVHRQSVNRWARQLSEYGVSGLRKIAPPGRKPQLTAANLNTIRKALKRGAEALGHDSDFWTTRRVADLIKRECGIRYHSNHIGKVLRKLGWSCKWLIIRASCPEEDTDRRWNKRRPTKHKKGSVGRTAPRMRQRKQFVRTIAWLPDLVLSGANSSNSISYKKR